MKFEGMSEKVCKKTNPFQSKLFLWNENYFFFFFAYKSVDHKGLYTRFKYKLLWVKILGRRILLTHQDTYCQDVTQFIHLSWEQRSKKKNKIK